MTNLYFGDHLDPKFIPKLIPRGPTGDELGDIPYLWIKLDQISFEWTFYAKNKIRMPNFYLGDDLDAEFIPRFIPRGPTRDELEIFLIYGSN